MAQKTIPRSAFQFLAPASVAGMEDGETAQKERTLTGVAYSGDVVTDHGYWSRLLIDLDSLSVDTPIPLLCQHDHGETIGLVTEATKDGALNISARLFSDVDDDAAEIAAKADKGFPWQLSVGIWPDSIEEVQAGASVTYNGRTFAGPLTVFRNSRVREISVCALGADHRTSATVLGAGDTVTVDFINHEDDAMKLEEALAKVNELEAEVSRLKAVTLAAPDPSKYVPFEAHQALNAELSALKAEKAEREVEAAVAPALADGRLLPTQEAWARDLGKSNFAALQSFLSTAQPIPALTGTQTGGKPPAGEGKPTKLSAEQMAIVEGLGLDPEEYLKNLEA